MKDEIRVRVLIEGRVQGVSMRYYTQRKANEVGVSGFVRNLSDGRVEAVFEGASEEVEAMLEWCKTGAPHARVDSIALRYEEPEGQFFGFNVRY